MSAKRDISAIEDQPPVRLWGEGFDEIGDLKIFKGKFVVANDGKFFAKLYPKAEGENIELFHDKPFAP